MKKLPLLFALMLDLTAGTGLSAASAAPENPPAVQSKAVPSMSSQVAQALAQIESAEASIMASLISIGNSVASLLAQLQNLQGSTGLSPADQTALNNAVTIANSIKASAAAVQSNATGAAGPGSPAVPGAPVITSSPLDQTNLGAGYDYQIAATNTPTSFAVNGTLPAGLTLNTTTGVITGTSTSVGIATVQISATNAAGTGTASLTIGVVQD